MKSSVLVLMSSLLTVGLLYAGQKFNGMSNGWLVIGAFIAVYIVLQVTITIVSEYSKVVGRKEIYGTHAKTGKNGRIKNIFKKEESEEERQSPMEDIDID